MRERLLLITDVAVAGGVENLCKKVAEAIAVAPELVIVELRDKQCEEREALATRVGAICRLAGTRWLVNGDLALAERLGADGVHLPEAGADVARTRAALPGRLIGVSTHSVDSARAHADADLVLLGPIWPTASKPGHTGLGADVLRQAAIQSLFAIGGVDDATRAGEARAAGAHGIAVIRAVLAAADPAAAVRGLLGAL